MSSLSSRTVILSAVPSPFTSTSAYVLLASLVETYTITGPPAALLAPDSASDRALSRRAGG